MSRQCRQVHFSGSVQGVGFRFTVRRLAEGYDVAGYVRNLPDGRVELVAEGTAEQIDALGQAIREAMGDYIRRVDQQISEPTGRFTGFDIRF
jgi:acylphosphatase